MNTLRIAVSHYSVNKILSFFFLSHFHLKIDALSSSQIGYSFMWPSSSEDHDQHCLNIFKSTWTGFDLSNLATPTDTHSEIGVNFVCRVYLLLQDNKVKA